MVMQVNKMAIALTVFCSQVILSTDALAFRFTEKVCQEYGLGKNWYCEKDEEKANDITANDILEADIPPEQKAIKINELWERQRKIAVITGKREDIERFYITQRFIAKKGIDFARNVQHL